MTEVANSRAAVLADLQAVLKSHYVSPEITARKLAALGAPATAQLLLEHVPTTDRARSGDLGEVLATEVAEQFIGFPVPVRRLRWKDGRNMALRGDDIIGVRSGQGGRLCILKGESKSRAVVTMTVLREAGVALDRDSGRPTTHSVLFVADRLWESGRDSEALKLEQATLVGFSGTSVEHLLFTVTGVDPTNLLTDHLTGAAQNAIIRHAVGMQITDHGRFIQRLFGGL